VLLSCAVIPSERSESSDLHGLFIAVVDRVAGPAEGLSAERFTREIRL